MNENQDDSELNELLNAVQNTTPEKETELDIRMREVQLFIRAKDIKASEQSVPLPYIYNAYSKWSKDPLKKQGFSQKFAKFFLGKMSGSLGIKVYYINPESIGLQPTYSAYRDPHYIKSKIKETKSQYLGVCYNRQGKIAVRVTAPDGTYKVINGQFKTLKAAARAYDKYVIELYGKDAVVNFPKRWIGQLHGTEETQQDQNSDPKGTKT